MLSDDFSLEIESSEFSSYYSSIWKDRWPQLFRSLARPIKYLAWINLFSEFSGQKGIELGATEFRDGLLSLPEGELFPPPPVDSRGLKGYYCLDGASALALTWLKAPQFEELFAGRVLDMCAAPGGKALQLAALMNPGGEMIAADISANRLRRLKEVFAQYLPAERDFSLSILRRDGTRWGRTHPSFFDLILLDAPCSSERHLLHSGLLGQWKKSRTRQLAIKQFSLLSSAFFALKPGGILIYMTCSISPLENDAVVEKLLRRRGASIRLELPCIPEAEKTELGLYFLPDRGGFGPLYISVFRKVSP